jgi:GTPase
MAFVDEIVVTLKAGRGGSGVVRWRHEKGKDKAGAAGGNGGRGGDVYARAVRDIGVLARYRAEKVFLAGNGQDGMRNSKHGKDGDDLYFDVPVGSVITRIAGGAMDTYPNAARERHQLLQEGETVFLLRGGRGGLGNEHFKASTNTTPWEYTPGTDGEDAQFSIELELIADAGLIGLPNAGKTSLLNALTNASAKVGDYQFTTLEPNLGSFYKYILADIPGLIEGASEGKGLGHRFLRHIKRTHLLLHCISLENESIKEVYTTVRAELEAFDSELADKEEILVLTKTDTVDEKILKKKITEAKKLNKDVLTVSIVDDASIKAFRDALVKRLRAFDKKS